MRVKVTFSHYEVLTKNGKGKWEKVREEMRLEGRAAGEKYRPRFKRG